jgi:hypothetical protein
VNQVEAASAYLLLVLADCDGHSIVDTTKRGHVTSMLRQKAGILSSRTNNDLVTSALRSLKESGSINYDRNTIVLLTSVDDTLRQQRNEIVRLLTGKHFLRLQQEVTFEDLKKWVRMGFAAIVNEIRDGNRTLKDSSDLYSVNPRRILEGSEKIPNEMIGTVLNYLGKLGLVYSSPFHSEGTWVVRSKGQVKPEGLRRHYSATR